MKKYLLFVILAATAQAQTTWALLYQYLGNGMPPTLQSVWVDVPAGGADGIVYYEGANHLPYFAVPDSTFSYNSTTKALTVSPSAARTAISLTNTGTSGAATYNNSTGVFNVPNYANSGGTVTSAGLTSADFTISGSPVTTAGNITANLNTSGISAGTYSGLTITTKGIATAGTTRSFTNTASKTLVISPTGQGGVVLDASRDVAVYYSISTSTTATIGGASTVTAFLEIATSNSATAGDWTALQTVGNGQTITLAIALQSIQTAGLTLNAIVPAGQYMRLRYATTGTGSCTYVNGQEVKL